MGSEKNVVGEWGRGGATGCKVGRGRRGQGPWEGVKHTIDGGREMSVTRETDLISRK